MKQDKLQNPLGEDLDHILNYTAGLWEELRGKRIFITGGTGFIGCWILESFVWAVEKLGLNATAVVLTRNSRAFQEKAPHLAAHSAIQLHQGDIRTFAFPPGEFSHVIHAATEASAKLNDENPHLMLDTIVQGTLRSLEFARLCGAQKFLLTSSGAVYGKQPSDMTHISETYPSGPDPLDVGSAYAEGKRLAELQCAIFSREYGLETKIARCFAFVGPYLPLDAHFAIGNFIRDGLLGGPIKVKGDGTPYRSYMYAADLTIWLWTILFKGKPCQPYNVGSEEAISISDLARAVAEVINPDLAVEIAGKADPGKPPDRYVPAISKALIELNLVQRYTLQEAIKRTALWNIRLSKPTEQRSPITLPTGKKVSVRSCPICGEIKCEVVRKQQFILPVGHPQSEGYEVVCCNRCGFVYADTTVSQQDYDDFYAKFSKYEDKFTATGGTDLTWDAERLKDTAVFLAGFLPDRNGHILDIGCANGGLLKSLQDLGYSNLCGVDPSPGCIANTKELPGIEAHVGTLSSLPVGTGQFDCIVLSHVMEHIQDLKAAAKQIYELLKVGGIAYSEVPDASRYFEYVSAPFQEFNTEHINHFSKQCLVNFFLPMDFKVISLGSKNILSAPDKPYPVIYGLFEKTDHQVEQPNFECDSELVENIRLYIKRSQTIMNVIEEKLQITLKESPEVIVWGTGQLTMKLLVETSLSKANIVAFVDGNPINHGKVLRGTTILSPDQINARELRQPIVIGSIINQKAIMEAIRTDFGINNEIIELCPI